MNYDDINLIKFQNQFSSDKACEEYLYKLKWANGYVCKRCGHTHYYVTTTRKLNLLECASCGYQTTVTVDTIFEKTRTDLTKWFLAIYLISNDKRGISATMLKEEIDVTYKTAWFMLHKIREAMGERDGLCNLSGIVELDDAYFGAPTEGGKRGRGTEQSIVLVGLSLNKRGIPQYLKMQVIDNIKGSTLINVAQKMIEPESEIHCDGYRSYSKLKESGYKIEMINFDSEKNPDHLHWLHIIIPNVKAFIGRTFHGLDPKHLQAYLNEFSYRFNRRKFKNTLFSRLLNCCVQTRTITFTELVG